MSADLLLAFPFQGSSTYPLYVCCSDVLLFPLTVKASFCFMGSVISRNFGTGLVSRHTIVILYMQMFDGHAQFHGSCGYKVLGPSFVTPYHPESEISCAVGAALYSLELFKHIFDFLHSRLS